MVEVVSREQRHIGQELHESVAQELTALNLLASSLIETLRNGSSKYVKLADHIAQGLQRSMRELRAVLRGLLPVLVDPEGLMAALSELAGRVQQQSKVTCTFDCREPVSFADNLAATHLYLIAQEAAQNAVTHDAATTVCIELGDSDIGLVLRVHDDGKRLSLRSGATPSQGLRIMRNHAAIIGARLSIEPSHPTGTVVTCVLARRHREAEVGEHGEEFPNE